MKTVELQLRARWVARVGYRYDVVLADEVLVRGSRDPEHDAARALMTAELHGRFRIIDAQSPFPTVHQNLAPRLSASSSSSASSPSSTPHPSRSFGLAAYCSAYALWAEAIEAIQKYGARVKSPSGYRSSHPMSPSPTARPRSCCASEFGFTPASRGRIATPKPAEPTLFDRV